MTIDENYMERLANAVAKTILDAIENLSIEDVNMYQIGYNKAIDDVVCKIEDYKDKHYHNRAEYPINYGLLCDMENWFYDMKGEKNNE